MTCMDEDLLEEARSTVSDYEPGDQTEKLGSRPWDNIQEEDRTGGGRSSTSVGRHRFAACSEVDAWSVKRKGWASVAVLLAVGLTLTGCSPETEQIRAFANAIDFQSAGPVLWLVDDSVAFDTPVQIDATIGGANAYRKLATAVRAQGAACKEYPTHLGDEPGTRFDLPATYCTYRDFKLYVADLPVSEIRKPGYTHGASIHIEEIPSEVSR